MHRVEQVQWNLFNTNIKATNCRGVHIIQWALRKDIRLIFYLVRLVCYTIVFSVNIQCPSPQTAAEN